jgi:hypothetical protein
MFVDPLEGLCDLLLVFFAFQNLLPRCPFWHLAGQFIDEYRLESLKSLDCIKNILSSFQTPNHMTLFILNIHWFRCPRFNFFIHTTMLLSPSPNSSPGNISLSLFHITNDFLLITCTSMFFFCYYVHTDRLESTMLNHRYPTVASPNGDEERCERCSRRVKRFLKSLYVVLFLLHSKSLHTVRRRGCGRSILRMDRKHGTSQ